MLSGQVGDQAALVFAKRHLARDQQPNVSVVHTKGAEANG
jgi:hypothetical protein